MARSRLRGSLQEIAEVIQEIRMPDFDAETLIAELDRLGMKLTALKLADGTFKVYRWRMGGASEHAKQIEALWNSQVGEDRARIDILAVHILHAEKARYGGGDIAMRKSPHD